ncbi:MAG: sigma-54-dependent Fis family transcriptional regulator [Bacteroidales bacterium]|nr:MAG: sigma-54-dependent Fis family transcriptional regulator [Bacteroidales bacterium]
MARILVVDDDSTFCLMLKTYLTKQGHQVNEAFSFDEASRLIRSNKYEVVLSDYRLPEKSGMEVLGEAKRKNQSTIVILMTGYADIRMAVKAIKLGAYDYVTKPINPDEILAAINNALSADSSVKPAESTIHSDSSNFIKGDSEYSQQVNKYISIVAPTNLSVIIHGDSGTGKEFIARQIHRESKRAKKPFVAIDCGALPKELAASEFFGHIKGSFTGAISDKVGQFEVANGGTLFLDEIGNLPYDVQVNLLRAIQERKVKRIGDSKEIPVDVRIIVATNENLLEMVNRGNFREDLYHRLNEFSIRVAPLYERKSDLLIFAKTFLDQANHELGKNINGFDSDVMDILMSYSWPGNLRELKNVIRRAVLLEQNSMISLISLPIEIIKKDNLSTGDAKKPDTDNLREMKEKAEYELIMSTLEKVRFNKSKAAQLLDIDRKTLYNKMKQYGIPY